jgi:hypothetical protein
MILLARLKFFWRIFNFAGMVFEIKFTPAKDPHQQYSIDARQKLQVAASANYRGVQWILGFARYVSSQYGFMLTVQ